jgi:hypothetical protein
VAVCSAVKGGARTVRSTGRVSGDGAGSEAAGDAPAAAPAARSGRRAVPRGGPRRRERARRPVANARLGGPRGADAARQQGPQADHGREQLHRRPGHPQGRRRQDGGRCGDGPRRQRELPRRARARRRQCGGPLAGRQGVWLCAVMALRNERVLCLRWSFLNPDASASWPDGSSASTAQLRGG